MIPDVLCIDVLSKFLVDYLALTQTYYKAKSWPSRCAPSDAPSDTLCDAL